MKNLPKPAKLLIALAVGLVAAKLFGILNASLDAANGQPHEAGWSIGLGLPFFWLALYLLGGIADLKNMRSADSATKRTALSLQPPTGSARVIVYREGFVAQTNPIDVAVDGDTLGQLTFSRFTALELRPGAHQLQAGITRNGTWTGQPKQADFQIAAGQTLVFRVSMSFRGVTLTPVAEPASVVRKLAGRTMVSASATDTSAA